MCVFTLKLTGKYCFKNHLDYFISKIQQSYIVYNEFSNNNNGGDDDDDNDDDEDDDDEDDDDENKDHNNNNNPCWDRIRRAWLIYFIKH